MHRRFMIPICLIGLGVLAVFTLGCSARTAVSLNGTHWLLVLIGGKPPLPDAPVTANFGKAQVEGTAGCNQYSANYTTSGDQISIGAARATMMACAEPIMAQEQLYLAALGSAKTYSVTANELALKDANGSPVLQYTKQSMTLAGSAWDVLSYNNGKQAVTTVIVGTQLTAKFGTDGTLSGFAGCNDYTATYSTSGTSIQISAPNSTLKACAEPPGVMEQESAYLAALPTAARYRIEAGKLELRTADGAIVATFAPAQ